MKRKILAIVLSLTIAVAFMPTMAFADDGGEAKKSEQIMAQIADLQEELEYDEAMLNQLKDRMDAYLASDEFDATEYANMVNKYRTDLDAIKVKEGRLDALWDEYYEAKAEEEAAEDEQKYADQYQKIKDFIQNKALEFNQAVRDLVEKANLDKAVEVIDNIQEMLDNIKNVINNKDEILKNFTDKIDQMIIDLDQKLGIVDWADDNGPKILETLDKIKEAIEKFREDKITPADFREMLQAMREEIVETYRELQEITEEAVKNRINALFEAADQWAENRGLTPENMAAFVALIEEMTEVLKNFEGISVSEIIDQLLDRADAKLAELKEAAKEAIAAQIDAFVAQVREWKAKGKENIEAMVEKAKEMAANIEAYIEAMDPVGKIKAKIEQAKAKIGEVIAAAQAKLQEDIDAFIAQVDAWKEKCTEDAQALIEKAKEMAEAIKAYMESIDTEAIKEKIEEAKAKIEELLAIAEAKLQEEMEAFLDKADEWVAKGKEAFWDCVEKAKELEAVVEAYIEQMDPVGKTRELIEKLRAKIAEITAKAQEILKEKAEKFIADTKALAEKIKEWAADKGLTPEAIQAIIAKAKELAEILKEYLIIDSPEEIQKIIEKAKAAFEQFKQCAMDKIVAVAMKALEMLENGDFDKWLEMIGLTKEQVEEMLWDLVFKTMDLVEKVKDAIAYFKSGESFRELTETVELLQVALDEAATKIQKQEAQINNVKKKLNNAAKLKKYRVVAKKPGKSGKKVYAKWKKFTKATINGYIVKYKVGKKAWKTKTVKNKNTVRKLIVKFKKGKKTKTVKVKVRAYYKMKAYNLTQTFYSKWSKVKTIKVKKVK